MNDERKQAALEYHARPEPGKIAIAITKPCANQYDLGLAYTPGVAEPVRAIVQNPEAVYRYINFLLLIGIVGIGAYVMLSDGPDIRIIYIFSRKMTRPARFNHLVATLPGLLSYCYFFSVNFRNFWTQ